MSSYRSAGISCAILVAAGFASSANAEQYLKSYTVTGHPDVHVQADNGGVHIGSSNGSTVEFSVKYDKSDWGDDSNAGPQIDSKQNGNRVELTALTGPHAWFGFTHNRWLSIEIHMPKDSDLQVETSNGAIDVSSLNGKLSVHSSNGGIKASDLSGTIDIGSSNGGIDLESLKGTMNVSTTNGGIKGNNLDGRCGLSTTNGSVRVAGRFDGLDISSGNGSVVARAETGSKMSAGWRIRTTNAGVDLSLPTNLQANVDASTSNGSVTVDLPKDIDGSHSKTELRGAMNGGGPEMTIHTTNGGIHIRGI
jgi:hypothetical protein